MLVDPYKLGKSDGRSLGRKDGVRASVTWLLNRAREMNDPQAKAILNSAAYSLGQDLKYRESELVALEHEQKPVCKFCGATVHSPCSTKPEGCELPAYCFPTVGT